MTSLGLIALFSAFVMIIYETYKGKQRGKVYSSAGLVFVLGLVLSFSDTISKITTSFGTVELLNKAKVDAGMIEILRSRVENQSATIDLIAKQATSAEAATAEAERQLDVTGKKLQDVDAALSAANNALARVQQTAELTDIVSDAQNDDRNAFNRLDRIANDDKNQFFSKAKEARDFIFMSTASSLILSYPVQWKAGVNPIKLTLSQMEAEYEFHSKDNFITRMAIIQYIWSRDDFDLSSKCDFIVRVAAEDQSVRVAVSALKMLAQALSLQITDININTVRDWWGIHEPEIWGP